MIRYIFLDVDGTLTNGTYHVDCNGNISKDFFTRDFWAIRRAQEEGFEILLVTGANDECTIAKACLAKIPIIYGASDKVKEIEELMKNDPDWDWESTAYMGDAENDMGAMDKAAMNACPSDAIPEVLKMDNSLISYYKGGEGAVYEFIRHIFDRENKTWLT